MTSGLERATAFEHRFARAQATEVIDVAWGFALLQSDFPGSHAHNLVVVTSAAPATDVLAKADQVLGGAGLQHRYVCVDDDVLGQALEPDFLAAGYERSTCPIQPTTYTASSPIEPRCMSAGRRRRCSQCSTATI